MESANQTNIKRSPAVKVTVFDIVNGKYVQKEGWTPNIVSTNKGDVARVNIIGVVISKEEEPGFDSLMIDDSTGSINLRSFEDREILKKPKIGQLVTLIGKPRKYGDEKYIVPEIVAPLKNVNWALVRKKELSMHKTPLPIMEKEEVTMKTPTPPEPAVTIPATTPSNPYEKILNYIKQNDEGFGVSYEDVIANLKLQDSESVILSLIEEGEIYEVRPGILKVL